MSADTPILLSSGERLTDGARLNPRLLSFVALSVFIGFQLFSFYNIHGDDVAIAVVILSYWTAFGIAVYVLCRVMRGKGGFAETLTITLELLAVLYVVGAIASIIATTTASYLGWWPRPLLGTELPFFFTCYMFVHDGLFAVYLPLCLGGIHRFGLWRRIAIGFFTFLGASTKIMLMGVLSVIE